MTRELAGEIKAVLGFAWTKLLFQFAPAEAIIRLAYIKGRAWYLLSPKLRERYGRRLSHFYKDLPPEKVRDLAKKHAGFHETVSASKQLAHMNRLPVERWCVLEGDEHIDQALAGEKGAILLTGHIGWPQNVIRPAMQANGYRIFGVGLQGKKPEKLSRFSRWVRDSVVRLPTQMPSWPDVEGSLNLRPLKRILDANGILFTAGDAKASNQLTTVDFLSRPTEFNGGIFRLAREASAPIIPAFALPDALGKGPCRLRIEESFLVSRTDDAGADVREAAQRFAALLEARVRERPYLYTAYRAAKRPPLNAGDARYRRASKQTEAGPVLVGPEKSETIRGE